MKNIAALIICIMILAIPMVGFAEPEEMEHEGQEAEASDHHEHSNHFALFIGATTAGIDREHSHTDFTLGIEYEYRLPFLDQLLGVGLFNEYIFAEHTEILLGIPIVIHPILGLKLFVAPSMMNLPDEGKVKFLFRSGVGYDIHISLFSITPTICLDLIDGDILALVYGLGLGIGF